MLNPFDAMGVVILAAGEGKRMKSDTPKVMTPLRGRPMIDFVVRAVEASGIGRTPIVVVTNKHTAVQDFLGDRAAYAIQAEQLGTGHAVGAAKTLLSTAAHVLVLYGDMPFIRSESIRRLIDHHLAQKNTLTLMSVTVPHFDGAYKPLSAFGRIVRNQHGEITKSVEQKDATPEESHIREVNPCYYCFDAAWLWMHLSSLENTNAQKEYYLTDLVRMAINEKQKVSSIPLDPKEAIGINTQADLALAASL